MNISHRNATSIKAKTQVLQNKIKYHAVILILTGLFSDALLSNYSSYLCYDQF